MSLSSSRRRTLSEVRRERFLDMANLLQMGWPAGRRLLYLFSDVRAQKGSVLITITHPCRMSLPP